MSCPFLQEARVRSCRAAGIRKCIIETGTPAAGERCSSAKFHDCLGFQEAKIVLASGDKCPLLDERPVRYCSAASIPHYVPWSEQAGQCGGSGHQFCDLWLSVARPRVPGQGSHDPTVNGIAVPRDLWYAPNHLWLQTDGGACHIGIDGFLARILAKVDQISFVTTSGVHQPSVVFSVCGVDWAMVFPNKVMITSVNNYLRHAPERLIADPYGAGWLFEAWPVPSGKAPAGKEEAGAATCGLINGEQGYAWMKSEVDRIADFVHHLDPTTLNDGGYPSDDFIQHLSREEVLRLMHEFFAPHAAWGMAI